MFVMTPVVLSGVLTATPGNGWLFSSVTRPVTVRVCLSFLLSVEMMLIKFPFCVYVNGSLPMIALIASPTEVVLMEQVALRFLTSS